MQSSVSLHPGEKENQEYSSNPYICDENVLEMCMQLFCLVSGLEIGWFCDQTQALQIRFG